MLRALLTSPKLPSPSFLMISYFYILFFKSAGFGFILYILAVRKFCSISSLPSTLTHPPPWLSETPHIYSFAKSIILIFIKWVLVPSPSPSPSTRYFPQHSDWSHRPKYRRYPQTQRWGTPQGQPRVKLGEGSGCPVSDRQKNIKSLVLAQPPQVLLIPDRLPQQHCLFWAYVPFYLRRLGNLERANAHLTSCIESYEHLKGFLCSREENVTHTIHLTNLLLQSCAILSQNGLHVEAWRQAEKCLNKLIEGFRVLQAIAEEETAISCIPQRAKVSSNQL